MPTYGRVDQSQHRLDGGGTAPTICQMGEIDSAGLPVRLGVEPLELSWHLSFYSRSQRPSADLTCLLQDISGHFWCVWHLPLGGWGSLSASDIFLSTKFRQTYTWVDET
jgi:hypothetical protein